MPQRYDETRHQAPSARVRAMLLVFVLVASLALLQGAAWVPAADAASKQPALLAQRDDLAYRILSIDESPQLADRVFVLENTTTGERHAIVTDDTGAFDTSYSARVAQVNAYDALLDMELPSARGLPRSNIWFQTTAHGSQVQRSEAMREGIGALPFGLYKLREVKSEANPHGPFQHDEFVVAGKAQSTRFRETLPPDASAPTVSSKLFVSHDGRTDVHVPQGGIVDDVVRYENLEHGRAYELVCMVFDYRTLKPVAGPGNSIVFASQTMQPKRASGSLKLRIPCTHLVACTDGIIVRYALELEGRELAASWDLSNRKARVNFFAIEDVARIQPASGQAQKAYGAVSADEQPYLSVPVAYTGLLRRCDYEFAVTIAGSSGDNALARGALAVRASTVTGMVAIPLTLKGQLKLAGRYSLTVTCDRIEARGGIRQRIYKTSRDVLLE